MEYYWEIELWDKEIIKVKPDAEKIKYIQELLAKGEGMLTTPTRSISVKNIKDFHVSDEVYTDQKLLEGASQAFNEPIETPEGIESRMVKKSVPRRRYDTHFRHISAYRVLEEGDNSVVLAFKLPTHQIDHTRVQELSPTEEFRLAK